MSCHPESKPLTVADLNGEGDLRNRDLIVLARFEVRDDCGCPLRLRKLQVGEDDYVRASEVACPHVKEARELPPGMTEAQWRRAMWRKAPRHYADPEEIPEAELMPTRDERIRVMMKRDDAGQRLRNLGDVHRPRGRVERKRKTAEELAAEEAKVEAAACQCHLCRDLRALEKRQRPPAKPVDPANQDRNESVPDVPENRDWDFNKGQVLTASGKRKKRQPRIRHAVLDD